jgi:hypothetical protein
MANIVRWEPFRDLISLREAMDRLFEESFVQPRIDPDSDGRRRLRTPVRALESRPTTQFWIC